VKIRATGNRRAFGKLTAGIATILAGVSGPAAAHGAFEGADVWNVWSLSPEIVAGLLVLSWVYFRGMTRRRTASQPVSRGRHVLFYAGVLAIFVALQSPVDFMAERLFAMHQVQHLLLRMLGPMLLMLSGPEGVLVAGLPRSVRHRILRPVVSNGVLRGVFGFLTKAPVAFLVFLASLYVWQIPSVHNAALLNTPLHYTMHITMLAAGMLFFWLMFDRRDPPAGIPRPVRLLMLIGTIVSNIVIGSITTLKPVVVYTAYDIHGRLFGTSPLGDEATGGYTMWVPASMMCLVALLVVVHGWGKQEDRMYARSQRWTSSNSAALQNPQTATEMRMKTRRANNAVAMTLVGVSLGMLVVTMTVVMVITVFMQR